MAGDHHHHHHDHGHHGHSHSHGHDHGDLKALGIALAITASFMGVEFVAGHLFGSLAVIADAWHMLSDAGSLGLALFATWIGRRPRSTRKTFGYRRLEVLAALANGVLLAAAAVLIVAEAWERWSHPLPIDGLPVAGIGFAGLVINLVTAAFLHHRSKENVNVRAALAHVLGDALGSCAAIGAGLVVYWTGELRADPLLSVAVSLLLLWSAWRILKDTSHILMEGTPEGLDPKVIERAILTVPGVGSVHDLHLWSISAEEPALMAHVVLAEGTAHGERVARSVCNLLESQFEIHHATIQPEEAPPRIVQLGTPVTPP
jgi:cobalt-zinc-cadmium efflux system protein